MAGGGGVFPLEKKLINRGGKERIRGENCNKNEVKSLKIAPLLRFIEYNKFRPAPLPLYAVVIKNLKGGNHRIIHNICIPHCTQVHNVKLNFGKVQTLECLSSKI